MFIFLNHSLLLLGLPTPGPYPAASSRTSQHRSSNDRVTCVMTTAAQISDQAGKSAQKQDYGRSERRPRNCDSPDGYCDRDDCGTNPHPQLVDSHIDVVIK